MAGREPVDPDHVLLGEVSDEPPADLDAPWDPTRCRELQ